MPMCRLEGLLDVDSLFLRQYRRNSSGVIGLAVSRIRSCGTPLSIALDAATSMNSFAGGVRNAVSEKVPVSIFVTLVAESVGWPIICPISPFSPMGDASACE